MAMQNKKCLCDGTSYTFCPDCSGVDRLAPSWKSEFCCEDCMIIWTTATKYNMNKISKSEAKAIISELNLKPIDQYVACVQRDLKVILAEDKKPKRQKKHEEKITIAKDCIAENDNIVVTTEEIKTHEVVNKEEE